MEALVIALAAPVLLLAFNPAVVAQVAIFLLMLAGLVVFHEFGHFIFAKRFGVTVEEFAVGFGPRIASVTRGGTAYSLNALPLGGYCKMLGEDTADDGTANPGNFQHKALWKRIVIIVAGPLFNLALAAIIFAFIGTALGIPVPTNVVDQVKPDTPASRAGWRPGDTIVALDGKPVTSGAELVAAINARQNLPVSVDVRRGSAIIHFNLTTTTTVDPTGRKVGILGFVPRPGIERQSFADGVTWGFMMVGATVALNIQGISALLTHHGVANVMGTVGVARVVIQAENTGLANVLFIAGELSVVLGLFNLLPIPALDGGRLAFLVVEGIRGRPVDPEKEGLVHLTGFALIMVLFVFITYHDIVQWISGKGGM